MMDTQISIFSECYAGPLENNGTSKNSINQIMPTKDNVSI